ncbi:methyltransferase domain-containing protein [Shumkonia mesophila]|uniref:methyltransferase domain-containing protein n=1 Tax=Shumkonia mesophila TaxID=2838854 RepID=UPI0029345E30|nr:methyltransferase domain-containing protein [Shumkonia mesophila]
MADPMTVFDRRTVRLHRERAAKGLESFDFLFAEVGERLADRLDDVTRRFPMALDLGCHTGILAGRLAGRGGIETLVACDLSEAMARRAGPLALAADEERLPFAEGVFDLVLSNLSLHWVNDLPGALVQIRRALRPDGLFLGALFGGATCRELRQALAEAEIAQEGGLSPRVSPLAEVRDAGNLLQRAGFALPVADSDTLTVSYADPLKLMADLRGMGEANAALARRRTPTRRATLAAAAKRYQSLFAAADGRVPATFEVIYLTAWAPHPSQQKPARPGSAKARLADALGVPEIPAGDKARPR